MTIPYFVYWEGRKPRWIDVCIKSMQSASAGCEFHLATPENIADYLPKDTLLANLSKLEHPSHRCDYYRGALLYHHGGFCFDADTIGLRSPEELASDKLVYSMWRNAPARVIGAYLGAPPRHPIVWEWLKKMMDLVVSYDSEVRLRWGAMIEEILTPMLWKECPTCGGIGKYPIWSSEHPDGPQCQTCPDSPGRPDNHGIMRGYYGTGMVPRESVKEVPRTIFMPVDIDAEPDTLMSNANPDDYVKPESVCFGLNYSKLMNENRDVMLSDERTWASSPHLVLKLLSRYL
jgi:Glycosyltransferase sugar-binding region containing DXD motif